MHNKLSKFKLNSFGVSVYFQAMLYVIHKSNVGLKVGRNYLPFIC